MRGAESCCGIARKFPQTGRSTRAWAHAEAVRRSMLLSGGQLQLSSDRRMCEQRIRNSHSLPLVTAFSTEMADHTPWLTLNQPAFERPALVCPNYRGLETAVK